jgi:hypothetical protein
MKKIYTSYNLEINCGTDSIKELENIDITKGVLNLEEVKAIDYTEIYLVTVIKDADGHIIKRSQCRII